MNLSSAYRKNEKQNGATAAWVLTFDPSLKQNKKEEFSTLKPDRSTTKCVLKTDKSVSLGKTRIHSKELQLSDFHLKLNVSSLAGLLWQTHKRSMLKNKSNHPEMTRSQLRSRQNVTTVYLHPCAGVCFWFVRSPCIPVQTQSLIKNIGPNITGYSYCWWKDLHGASRWRDIPVRLRHPSPTHLFTSLSCRILTLSARLHLYEKTFSQRTNQHCLK